MSIEDAISGTHGLPNLPEKLRAAQNDGANAKKLLSITRRVTAGYTALFVGLSIISALIIPIAWFFIALARNAKDKKNGRPPRLPLIFFTVPFLYTRRSILEFKSIINNNQSAQSSHHEEGEDQEENSDISENEDSQSDTENVSTKKSSVTTEKEEEEKAFKLIDNGQKIIHTETGKTIFHINPEIKDHFTTFKCHESMVAYAGTKNGMLYKIDLDVDLDGLQEIIKLSKGPINAIKVAEDQTVTTYHDNNGEYTWQLDNMSEDSSSSEEEFSSEDLAASYGNFYGSENKNKEKSYDIRNRYNATILENGDILACDLVGTNLELNLFNKNDRRHTPEPKLSLFSRENAGFKYAQPSVNEHNNFAIFYCIKAHLMACDFKGDLIRDTNVDWLSEETRVFPINFNRTKNNFYADVIVFNDQQFTQLKIKNGNCKTNLLTQAIHKTSCISYMPLSKNIYFQGQSMEGGNAIYLLNAETKKLTKAFELEKDNTVLGITESSDKQYLSLAFDNGEVALLKAKENSNDYELIHKQHINTLEKKVIFAMRFVNEDKDLLIATNQENSVELKNFTDEMVKAAGKTI